MFTVVRSQSWQIQAVKALHGVEVLLLGAPGAPKWCVSFFSTKKWYVVAFEQKMNRPSSIVALVATSDASLTIGKTRKYTVRATIHTQERDLQKSG